MAFDEVQFPTTISWGATGGPTFSTTVVTLSTGYEQRNQNWEYARGRWIVGHNLKFDSELQDLIAFFRSRRGKARGFRFKDWADYTLTDEVIGAGDGVEDEYQIIKTYADSESINSYERTITKPVDGTIVVSVDSVTQTETTDYTLDHTTGIITFTTGHIPASGKTITVSGEFDTPARFDTDQMDINLEFYNLSNWAGIPIVELPDNTT